MQLYNLEQDGNNQKHTAKCKIEFLAKRWRRRLKKKAILKRLWDFGIV